MIVLSFCEKKNAWMSHANKRAHPSLNSQNKREKRVVLKLDFLNAHS